MPYCSTSDTQERLCLISLGEKELVADLQHCTYNPGRPFDKFNDFFHHLASVVKEIITPNEQQHLTAHLSQWITLGVRLDGKSYQKMHSKYTDSSKSTRVEAAVCIQNMHGHSH